MKRVSLVLGSGGARGLAHIGVIQWLQEHDYQIESISGCSMGALIGGAFAAGKLDEFESWARAIDRFDIVKLLDLSWSKSGLIKGDRVINELATLVGNQRIEDLEIKFTAVAADLNEEKEVWINQGSLFDAIRASISLPMFFTPHTHNGICLVDGGVLNPVPIAPTFGDNTDLTIAVSLGGRADPSLNYPQKTKALRTVIEDSGLHEKIERFIDRFRSNDDQPRKIDLGVYEIATQAIDAMQSTIARQKLASYPPDILIEIPRNCCGTFEFDRADEVIELGYQQAKRVFSADSNP